MADYVKNADLMKAILESKEKGSLTPETISMFYLMIQGISKKMAYKDPEDKAASKAALDFFKYALEHDTEAMTLDYVPLTSAQKAEVKKIWSQIK